VGVSAFTPIVIALAARTDVPQTVAATASVGQGFDDVWHNALFPLAVAAMKTSNYEEPKIVQTVKVEPTSEVIPPIVLTEEKRKPKYHKVKDICQRHGLRKKQYGRKWRCK
jgi:hypothetical protein